MRWKQQIAAVMLSGVLAIGVAGCAQKEEPAEEAGAAAGGGEGIGGLDMDKVNEAAGAAKEGASN